MEGESDEKVLPILGHRILTGSPAFKALNLRGKGNLLNLTKVASIIKYNLRESHDISKVLLCIDSECTDVEATKLQLATPEQALQRSFPDLPVRYVVVDHSLEGWLLQDREAIQETLGRNSKLPQYGNPEENCRPAELLQELFEKNGRYYKKTVHATIHRQKA